MDTTPFEQFVDHLLTYLSLAHEDKKWPVGKIFGITSLKYWDGAEPWFGDHWDKAQAAEHLLSAPEDRVFVHPDDLSARDLWPVDISTVRPMVADDDKTKFLSVEEHGFMLSRVRSLTPLDTRGRFYAKYAAEQAFAIMEPDGRYWGGKHWFGSQTGRDPWRVHHLNLPQMMPGEDFVTPLAAQRRNRNQLRGEIDPFASNQVQMALVLAFTRFYEWTVTLGYEGFPSLLFPTDPLGAMEVFRLRDLPEGKSRRAALRNWVIHHWRRKRADQDTSALIQVRQHLRGATQFHWNGLACRITPSAHDLKKNDFLKQDREKERKGGRHAS